MKQIHLTFLAAMLGLTMFAQTPRYTVVGDAKKVLSWTGQNPREESWYLDDRNYRHRIKVAPTENGAVVLMDNWREDIEVLRIHTTNRKDLQVGIYTYDFNGDGTYEAFIVYSPKPGEAHMKVYYRITDERPWLIGHFQGLDRFILKGPLVLVPYEYFYEEHAHMHKYAYYDRDFYEMVRHDPEGEEPADNHGK